MDLTRLQDLTREVRGRQDEQLAAEVSNADVRRLLANRAGSRRQRQLRRLLWVGAASFTSLLVAVVVVVRLWPEPVEVARRSISFDVEGAPGMLNEWIASEDTPVALAFSDGTAVALGAHTQARVVNLSSRGAEVVLEAGSANVDVVPHSGARWLVRAGPFVVNVKGTRFDVVWGHASDSLDLSLHEGEVAISGCGFLRNQVVVAGQRIRASCRERKMHLGAAATSEVLGEPTDEPADAPGAPSGDVDAGEGSRSLAVEASRRVIASQSSAAEVGAAWIEFSRSGRHREAYEAAHGLGLYEGAPVAASELMLLATSARLSGHAAEARDAYQRVRTRFGGTSDAAVAAFELGRLASRVGQRAAAARWFELYLSEQRSGPWEAPALGRLMECYVSLGNTAGAERRAHEYLERFPNGPHSDAARQVVASHSDNRGSAAQ